MSQNILLTIDIGTTGIRVIAFDGEGGICHSEYRELTMSYPKPDWVEQDPVEMVAITKDLLQKVAWEVGNEDIVGITITNQRETIIVWDAETGAPLYPAVVWQDKRTREVCEELKIEHEETVRKLTGLRLDPYFSASKLAWIINEVQPVGGYCFGTPESYILWHLTVDHRYETEISNASRTLLYSIVSQDWDTGLAAMFGLPADLNYPEVIDSDGDFGQTDAELLGKSIPIVAVLGDQQASLYGQTGFTENLPKNTYGTGLFLMSAIGHKPVLHDHLLTTVAGKIDGQIHYAYEGSVFIGGSLIQWLRDGISILDNAADSQPMAERLQSNEGVYLVPAFVGLGAPYWEPAAEGLITGLTRATTRDHFARASLEALAYQTRDVLDAMLKSSDGVRLQVDGGATANSFLMQFVADICQVPVVVAPIAETTAWGSALLGGIKLGIYTDAMNFSSSDRSTVYEPQMVPAEAERLYAGWKKAVARSLQGI